jgi:hypothetical protein
VDGRVEEAVHRSTVINPLLFGVVLKARGVAARGRVVTVVEAEKKKWNSDKGSRSSAPLASLLASMQYSNKPDGRRYKVIYRASSTTLNVMG